MEPFGKSGMNCEQVEATLLDLDHECDASSSQIAAALAHLSQCSHCAALQESWELARQDLRAWAADTGQTRTPARVEMRLMQEFRTRHRHASVRRAGFFVAWALAGAALVIAGVSWWNARHAVRQQAVSPDLSASVNSGGGSLASALDDSSTEFTPLPGVLAADTEESAILRVSMPRSSLAALGLPVNEQCASEWIQVDLLVANDGSPQAVRLAPEED